MIRQIQVDEYIRDYPIYKYNLVRLVLSIELNKFIESELIESEAQITTFASKPPNSNAKVTWSCVPTKAACSMAKS